jgi:hypothetical protein
MSVTKKAAAEAAKKTSAESAKVAPVKAAKTPSVEVDTTPKAKASPKLTAAATEMTSADKPPVPPTSVPKATIPKTSIQTILSFEANPILYSNVGQLLGQVEKRVKVACYTDYLSCQLSTQPPLILKEVSEALGMVRRKVRDTVKQPTHYTNYHDWIVKEQHLAKLAAQELARKSKLTESVKTKHQLEEKLKQVSSDIHKLAEENSRTVKLGLQDSSTRKRFFSVQERLAFENREEANKRRTEQAERHRRLKERREQLEAKIEEEQKTAAREQLLSKEQAEQQYKAKLADIKATLELRQRQRAVEMKQTQLNTLKLKRRKPMYLKMQETYSAKVELPMLAKTKADLAKKRELFSPFRKDEFALIALQHDVAQKSKRKERQKISHSYSAKGYSTRFTEIAIEQERRERLEVDRIEKERRMLSDKKKQYASLVKQLHPPTIDDAKKTELEELRKKIHHTVSHHRFSVKRSLSPQTVPKSHSWKAKSVKAQTSKSVKESKPVDYLADLRKDRSEYDPTAKVVTEIKGKLATLINQS